MILGSESPLPNCWIYKGGGNKTRTNQDETMDCPTSATTSLLSDRNTGSIKAACSSLCGAVLSGLLSEKGFQMQKTNLHPKLHFAVAAWQFHRTAEKTSRKLFHKAVTSARGAVVRQQSPLFWKGYKNTDVQHVLWGGVQLCRSSSHFIMTLQLPLMSQLKRF